MNGITIFMEGGGSALGSAAIRQGMGEFLTSVRSAARKKGIVWNLVPCGSRENTFARFSESLDPAQDAVARILLVDAEAVVAATDPRVHLRNQDGWDLTGVPADTIHLMVQVMETWIVADPDALGRYYGRNFVPGRLPSPTGLENRPKAQIETALRNATKRTKKGSYHKIKHASKLLGRIDPAKVRARCPHCSRLFEELDRIIEAAR